ncbi:hypothetical protein [Georgenia sp. H159]|uniref:hypothetical protein n=1 Tax=Georgenia sp. H159 TaxID=3076115 RepID=UPI002D7890C5|nr:hypothetical protein [Georgenia sp. H159]
MPKADRILANLPPTFRLRGDPSALRAVADAYGGELQTAENALVAVMRAHWVEFADAGEPRVTDLALIGALYGLAPREDESVEEFRDHLLRFVRTHLEGTVTVRGILRITAEALGLHIEDDALETWWDRPEPVLVSHLPRGADAATLVLGTPSATVAGRDAAPAALRGRVVLGETVNLTGPHTLWVARDDGGALPVDLTTGVADPAAVTPEELVAAVVAELGEGTGRLEDGHLVLVSPTAGPGSAVVAEDGPGDAAELVLGLRPRTYTGQDATRARIAGTVDLSTPLDLRAERYLRLLVDGDLLAEVDCAAGAADPAAVDVAEVSAAINTALGTEVATDDGRFLTLISPTLGAAGSLVLQEPAAQPATRRLLGDAPTVAVGSPPRPARVVSDRPIGRGVDLTEHSVLRLALDDETPVSVDVAGLDPAATTPGEIVAAVNEGLGAECATHDGDRITLASPTDGAAGSLHVAEDPDDAAPAVLGLDPRSARGTPPVTASLTGTADLSGGVSLASRHLLRLGVDGGPPVDVDLRAGVADRTAAQVGEIAAAVNTALGAAPADPVATDDGAHLILVSSRAGAAGSLAVEPLVTTSRRRFVTRARVTDDAATTVLGFTARRAVGAPATTARLAGTSNLSGGVDLTTDRYVRVRVGDRAGVDVDCAGPRARATTAAEVAERLGLVPGLEAHTDGRTITLVDPMPGAASRVVLEPPRVTDALDAVLGRPPGLVRGEGAAGVRLTGTVDLSAGVELPADAALRLGVDGAPAVDVAFGDGATTAVLSLSALVARVNGVLVAQVAAHDGTHLVLTSPTTGAGSALEVAVPTAGTDVTAAVLGFPAPRGYAGRAATAARVVGTVDLTGGADLRAAVLPPRPAHDPALARHLRIAVDGAPPVTVDLLAAGAPPDPAAVDAATVTAAIRAATAADAVTEPIPGGLAVALSSPTTGSGSRLELLPASAGDAAPLLLGTAGASAAGTDAAPARVTGEVDLLGTVDLSERSVLRLAVDGGEPVDVDVAGVTPAATLAPEIVAAVEEVLPGVASIGAGDRLLLTSPEPGGTSAVEVLPVRYLEVVEYPPASGSVTAAVAHGAAVRLTSAGVADVPGRVVVGTGGGVSGPTLSDPAAGWSVHVDVAVGAGGRLVLEPDGAGGVRARVRELGEWHDVAGVAVVAGSVPPLTVRRGTNRWSWTECDAARFDHATFDTDTFAGGPCRTEAVFDVARFAPTDPPSFFAAGGPRPATAEVTVGWDTHAAGAFTVHLPTDLDPRFGRPFGEARFGSAAPEVVAGVVTDPVDDDDFVVTRVNTRSRLVEARIAARVPIGWTAVPLPFRDPVHLTHGGPAAEAKVYVSGAGLAPQFLEIRAAEPGAYGNDITVSARAVGPEIYDLEVHLAGARFENARAVVAGPQPPTLAEQLLRPSPVGVATAKAAGIRAVVTRDRVSQPAGPGPQEEGSS